MKRTKIDSMQTHQQKPKKNKLDDIIRIRDLISSYISQNEINRASLCIYLLNAKNILLPYLSDTDYFISNWAFEHESMILLTELFKLPEERHQFLMLSHNNYFVVKQFIQRTIQLPFEEYQQTADIKRQILNLIVQFKPHILQEVVEKAIEDAITSTQTIDLETIRAIKTELKEILNKLNRDNSDEQTDMPKKHDTLENLEKTPTVAESSSEFGIFKSAQKRKLSYEERLAIQSLKNIHYEEAEVDLRKELGEDYREEDMEIFWEKFIEKLRADGTIKRMVDDYLQEKSCDEPEHIQPGL